MYLHAIAASNGWKNSTVSGAISLFYLVSALLLIPVGSGISRFGPRLFVAVGAFAMALGVVGVGRAFEPWQVYLAFPVMGIGWACLSTTAVATTLAPWFERQQGRAISIASIGASAGGMLGPPLILAGIAKLGFASTTGIAGGIVLLTLLPLAVLILRHRPEDMGLQPDGALESRSSGRRQGGGWDRRTAMRTPALTSTITAFGIGMSMQIGFLTHQVTLLSYSLSNQVVAATITTTAGAALAGRLVLIKFADKLDIRGASSAVLTLAAVSYCAIAFAHGPLPLICACALFGLTVGNVTTLSPILVRKEFGSSSFGNIYGIASCAIQFFAAFGPSFYGFLHDASGSYRAPLVAAAALDVLAAWIILGGRNSLSAKRSGHTLAS